jgi:hypothetical protein
VIDNHKVSNLKFYFEDITLMVNVCAWCEAPRKFGPVCPSCGANYVKADAIKSYGKARVEPGLSKDSNYSAEIKINDAECSFQNLVKNPELEKQICFAALPIMLAGAWLVQMTGVFSSLQRIVFGMPLHEFGHATTAWIFGFNAVPTFWKTVTAQSRGFICPFLLFLGIGLLANYGRKTKQTPWILLAVLLWVIQVIGISAFDNNTMRMLITFGGDGMGMILATVFMATFYLGKNTQHYKGQVRWGILFIGAAAFMDMFMSWWRGQYDIDNIGYGLTGGMYTDAYLLINQYGWSWEEMISRHLYIGYACLTTLIVVYYLGIRQANKWVDEKQQVERLRALKQKS